MKPEDLLDPAEFPDDLKWVAAHHKLHPTDPVYLLIAWHWRRVKQSEDTLKAAIVELKSALDVRVRQLSEAADTLADVNEALAGVQDALEEKPGQLGEQLDAKLNQPLANAVAQLQALEKSLTPLARTFQKAQRWQILSALLVGVTLGVLSAVIVLLA
jgi:septal ring factor EnvC (AmiA/AmiB activator)